MPRNTKHAARAVARALSQAAKLRRRGWSSGEFRVYAKACRALLADVAEFQRTGHTLSGVPL